MTAQELFDAEYLTSPMTRAPVALVFEVGRAGVPMSRGRVQARLVELHREAQAAIADEGLTCRSPH